MGTDSDEVEREKARDGAGVSAPCDWRGARAPTVRGLGQAKLIIIRGRHTFQDSKDNLSFLSHAGPGPETGVLFLALGKCRIRTSGRSRMGTGGDQAHGRSSERSRLPGGPFSGSANRVWVRVSPGAGDHRIMDDPQGLDGPGAEPCLR